MRASCVDCDAEARRGAYEAREFGRGAAQIMALADAVNHYVDEQKPWVLAKDPAKAARCMRSARWASSCSACSSLYLKPVLPKLHRRGRAIPRPRRRSSGPTAQAAAGARSTPYKHLMTRIDPKQIEACSPPAAKRCKPAAGTRGTARPLVAANGGRNEPTRQRAAEDRRATVQRRSRSTTSRRSTCASRASSTAELGRRRGQAAASSTLDVGEAKHAHRVRRHPVGLRAAGPGRPADGDGREPRAAQDALRPVGRHGARRGTAAARTSSCCRPDGAPHRA